ncbi:MAG TPA: His/Gly/Thr/Pro-type tRNA ligase C-terminal domain-containing protein, partial [Candidatus Angelobacter sp.]|nr:His/Gly/Thr/Pro-type tRNA ligase C-terminal domain-containing protein [Candidatus Angelobacter sp.]
APGIGFAIGEDRLIMALQEAATPSASALDVYIAPLGLGMNIEAARLARELRRRGVTVSLGDETFRLKKSLETASKIGAKYALIVGENEIKSGQFALKNLGTGEQVNVDRENIAAKLRASGNP